MNTRTNRNVRGFTLTELLVVIAIIVLLIGPPVVSIVYALRSANLSGAVRQTSSAVATTRVYATRKQSFSASSHKGSAFLYVPSGEVRVIYHVEEASYNGQRLVDMGPPHAGYADLPGEDRFNLPEGVNLICVTRGGLPGSGGVQYFSPPFAIKFNSSGQLIASRNGLGNTVDDDGDGQTDDVDDNDGANTMVIYDGTGDGNYDVETSRSAGYNPNLYDPRSLQYNATNFQNGTINFGIDKITVGIALIAYDVKGLAEANPDGDNDPLNDLVGQAPAGQLKTSVANWIRDNGRVIYFNRHSGVALDLKF